MKVSGKRTATTKRASKSPKGTNPIYTDREPRISKDNLFMVLALWMERFPVGDQETADSYRKVGAVLVRPNDMLYAVDCSRDGVHGIARLLTKHYDVTKDCKIFVSRKPCSFCTKLLVQCKIKRVFYLPIEPEYKDVEDFREETSRVDDLFKASSIGQSVFVLTVGRDVLANCEKKHTTQRKTRNDRKKELLKSYWKNEWIKKARNELPWPAFDENMKKQVKKDFNISMGWMAGIIEEKKGYTFQRIKTSRYPTRRKLKKPAKMVSFNPSIEEKQASTLITMARFLAERSDDPKTGVGAVITNRALEIVALGWNGFPTRALYGEFPRASHDDKAERKKYPFTIHAEQNALLFRNNKNLANGILFVTKTPCNECTPLLAMEGIKTVLLGEKMEEKAPSTGTLGYQKFPEQLRKDTFTCFEMHVETAESMDGPPRKKRLKGAN